MSKMLHIRIWFIATLVVLLGFYLFLYLHHEDSDDSVTFSLLDTSGKKVSERDLLNQWTILTFGFTSCPDICPTQAYEISQVLDHMAALDRRHPVRAVLVSVDYLRDDSHRLLEYLDYFHSDYVGFVGSRLQLDLMLGSFGARYSVVSNRDMERNEVVEVNHTSTIYIIDPRGKINRELPSGINSKGLINYLEQVI